MIPAHPRSVHQLIENKARSKHEANLMCEPLTPALDEYSHLYSRTPVFTFIPDVIQCFIC